MLVEATQRWLASLPEPVRPLITSQRHPHVLNRLCAAWSEPARMRRHFLDLLIDQRGTRRGFSFEVHGELCALENFYVSQLGREQRAEWERGARLP